MKLSTISGFMQGSFDKKFLDQIKLVVNSNAGKITANGKGKGFNQATDTKTNNQGTLDLMNLYDETGANITYTDASNNTYYLCASYKISSSVPQPVNPGIYKQYFATNTVTITFFGQYFGLGTPPPGSINVGGYTSLNYGNYYQLWAGSDDTKVAVGNPAFSFNVLPASGSQPYDVSFYLNAIQNNGVVIINSSESPKTCIDNYKYTNSLTQTGHTVKSTLTIGYGDLSSKKTNIFTNSTNKSLTFKNLNSTNLNTTFYNDYNNNNLSKNSACNISLQMEVSKF